MLLSKCKTSFQLQNYFLISKLSNFTNFFKMAVYALYCTLCKTNHSNLYDWNEHLTGILHQKNTRKECWQWDKSGRKCCVVIYSKTNLSKSIVKSVIPYLMENLTNGVSAIITDLILSTERLGIGILRFENRERVNQLFSTMTSSSIRIDNQLFQFRQLGKFLKLEWEELLISSFNIEVPNQAIHPKVDSLTTHLTETASSKDNSDNQTDDKISCQVNSILKQIEIPDEEFDFAENVMKEVRRLSNKLLPQNCITGMYRNNYLKLRNNLTSSRYHIFMYMSSEQETGFTPIDENTRNQIFHRIMSIKSNPKKKSVLGKLDVEKEWPKTNPLPKPTVIFVYRNLGIEFRLSTFPSTMASLQLSRLVFYYCQFDPRVKPLLSLVHFWAKLNKITLFPNCKIRGRSIHAHELDPVALEWLLLFFLFHVEHSLPVPRLILGRPHQTILVSKIDVGFNEHLEFAKNWENEHKKGYPSLTSEESAKNLLLIFTKFMKFCSKSLEPGRHIMNVRDGEILSSKSPPEPFILNGPTKRGIKDHKFGNYLTGVEESYISNIGKSDKNRMIVMISPFELRWRLSICYDNWFDVVHPKIKATAEKLDKFIRNIESCSFENCSLEAVLFCN